MGLSKIGSCFAILIGPVEVSAISSNSQISNPLCELSSESLAQSGSSETRWKAIKKSALYLFQLIWKRRRVQITGSGYIRMAKISRREFRTDNLCRRVEKSKHTHTHTRTTVNGRRASAHTVHQSELSGEWIGERELTRLPVEKISSFSINSKIIFERAAERLARNWDLFRILKSLMN